jgi:hypothetical protein
MTPRKRRRRRRKGGGQWRYLMNKPTLLSQPHK